MTSSLDMIRGRSNIVTLTNNSGGALVSGDVCVQDTAGGDEYVTTTTSAASTLKIFVAAESIANGATGRFYESGYCPLVNVNASVTRGRFLFTHTAAKQAAENATYGTGAFGKVLKSGTSPSAIIYSATAQIGSAGAPTDATYVTTAANGDLSAEVIRPELKNYDPDSIPSSPSAYDDEFNDDTINTGLWTLASYDASFSLIQTSGAKHLSESLCHGVLLVQGDWAQFADFYQAFAPTFSDDWTLAIKMNVGNQPGVTDSFWCVGVRGQSDNHFCEMRVGQANTVRIISANGAGSTEAAAITFGAANNSYLLISKDTGTNFSFWHSHNGIAWNPIKLNLALTNMNALTRIYFWKLNVAEQTDPISAIDFVRYFAAVNTFIIGANP